MTSYKKVVVLLFVTTICISLCNIASANRVSELIYNSLQNNFTCFRRMNATHQTGCTSSRNGNVGIIHILEKVSDVDWLVESATNPPYVVVFLQSSLFTMKNMLYLKKSNKVNGALVAYSVNATTDYPNGFSPDSSCPNEGFGLYISSQKKKYARCTQGQWIQDSNPGVGLLNEDWGFPISLISIGKDLDKIKKCFDKFNKHRSGNIDSWSMCAAEIKSRMSAAKDTPTCMRRSSLITNINPTVICDPLGDKNLYTFLHSNTSLGDRSIIVVTARMDASSMFFGLTPGADSAVSGMVSLLAISQALSQVQDKFSQLTNNKTNIMFILFNGESFDYIGSSRMVYDMIKDKFTLKLSQISHIIELNQLIAPNSNYWIHSDPMSASVANLSDLLKQEGAKLKVKIDSVGNDRALPPASVQSFLAEDDNISAIVLTNFDKVFINGYYNSIYDNPKSLNFDNYTDDISNRIAEISTVVARAIFKLSTNEDTQISIQSDTIKEMLKCYLNTASCDLFKQALPSSLANKLAKIPYSLYVSVSTITNEVTVATSYLLRYLSGTMLNVSESDCNSSIDSTYSYFWINGPMLNDTGRCYRSLVQNHTAISPAFETNDWTSSKYSTWTESRWDSFTIRIFLKPSKNQEILTLVVGLSIFLISLVLVYFANKRSEILFGPITSDILNHGVPC